jgi:hypothetical protein
MDWSAQNVLAVGLGVSVYLWSAATSKVTQVSALASGSLLSFVSFPFASLPLILLLPILNHHSITPVFYAN